MGQRERAGEAGISLVEVLVAMSVLAVVMTGFAHLVIGSVRSLSLSEARQQAYTVATTALESARALGFEYIAHPPVGYGESPFDLGAFDPDGGTLSAPGNAEQVVYLAGGEVDDSEPYRLQADGLNLYTVVTRPDPTDAEQVRVTAVVEFDRAGQREVLRQSTLVNRAVAWGLAQPRFSVTPVTAGLQIERGRVDHCVVHEVHNLGVDDQYRVMPPDPTQVAGLGGYTLTFEEIRNPALTVPLVPGALTAVYGTGESFGLRTCFDASPSASSISEVPLVLQSRVAEETSIDAAELASRSQQIVYGLNVETERVLFLGSRREENRVPPLPYLAEPDPPTFDVLANYSLDLHDGAGLLLPRADGSNEAYAARWRHELGNDRALHGATVRFWYGSRPLPPPPAPPPGEDPGDGTDPESPDGSSSPEQPDGPRTAVLRLRLHRLIVDAGTSQVLAEHLVSLPVHDDGWSEQTVPFSMSGPIRFEPGDNLELEIGCDATSDSDCLLAFDSVSFPAALTVHFAGATP